MKDTLKRTFGWLPFLLPLYIVRFHIGTLPTTLLEVGVGILTIWWFAERRGDGLREAWMKLAPWKLPLALWIIAGVIGVIVSPVHVAALGLFRAYFVEPVMVFIIGLDLVRTEEDRERLWRSFQIVTGLLMVYAVIQLIVPHIIPSPWNVPPNGPRATSIFPFPNALSLFVTPIAALAAARAIHLFDAMKAGHGKALSRYAVGMDVATFLAGGIAILCAQSDGGVVALAAAVLVTLLLHRHSRRFAIELVIVGAIVIVAIAPLRAHIRQVVTLNDWSGEVRRTIWSETFAMLKDHPIFGAGLSGYPTAILPYHHAWMEVFQYPHDILLNLWSETGLLGIVAFTWIIIAWVRQGWRGPRNIMFAVVTAILVHGLVDVPYFKNDLAIAFWLLVILTTYESKTTSR